MEAGLDLIKRITISPDQCGGRPCVRGLRIRVSDVLSLLSSGASPAEILEDYPVLEEADIRAVLEYAARQADHPVLIAALSSSSTRNYPLRLRAGFPAKGWMLAMSPILGWTKLPMRRSGIERRRRGSSSSRKTMIFASFQIDWSAFHLKSYGFASGTAASRP